MNRKLFPFLIVFLSTLLTACSSSYSFQLWSFPESIKPHEPGWTYLGKTLIYDRSGIPPTQVVEKRGIITIIDHMQNELLRDEFQVSGGSFVTKPEWAGPSLVKVRIFGLNPATTEPVFEAYYQLHNGKFERISTQQVTAPDVPPASR